jgi:sigma-B regulation protein RsbU (phosphoserine phosphatase)
MKPAKEVGGDFYDYFEIDDHRIALVMADVSGKGIPAALFMMVSKTLIKSFDLRGALTPAQVLAAVNGVLCENNKADFFVTVWLGFLDWKTGHLVTANAGHEFPMMKGPKGLYSLVRDKHGLPAGSLEDLDEKNYVMTEFDLEPGSKVFVYTDGVAEALNNRSEQFGRERILACLDRHKDCDSRETVEAMWSELQVFVGEAPQFDDVTMMQIEYKGSGREEG